MQSLTITALHKAVHVSGSVWDVTIWSRGQSVCLGMRKGFPISGHVELLRRHQEEVNTAIAYTPFPLEKQGRTDGCSHLLRWPQRKLICVYMWVGDKLMYVSAARLQLAYLRTLPLYWKWNLLIQCSPAATLSHLQIPTGLLSAIQLNNRLSNLQWKERTSALVAVHRWEENLFICQVTVSHQWIKRAVSLIKKINVCTAEAFLCGLMVYWREAHLTKTYITAWTTFVALYHITQSERTVRKSKWASVLLIFR